MTPKKTLIQNECLRAFSVEKKVWYSHHNGGSVNVGFTVSDSRKHKNLKDIFVVPTMYSDIRKSI